MLRSPSANISAPGINAVVESRGKIKPMLSETPCQKAVFQNSSPCHALIHPCFCFADTPKAFDAIEWSFMKEIMAQIEMKEHMTMWIDFLYDKAMAKILPEGCTAEAFMLERVRQRCPLASLLLSLHTEVLVLAVWQDQNKTQGHLNEYSKAIHKKDGGGVEGIKG